MNRFKVCNVILKTVLIKKTIFLLLTMALFLPITASLNSAAVKNVPLKSTELLNENLLAKNKATATVNSKYLFENNLNDESNQYNLILNGDESYTSSANGMGLNLSGKRWVDLPLQLSQDLQRDKSFSISADFMLPNTGIDESTRIILSNKSWSYDEPGFKITAYNEKTEWQPEGMLYVDFNIGVGVTEIYGRFYDIPMDQWHRVSVDIDFEDELVSFGINGRIYQQSLTANINGNTIDPSVFIEWLGQRKIRLGAHYSDDSIEPPWHDSSAISGGNNTTAIVADAYFDNLIVQSPKPAGDPAFLGSALTSLTQFLEGSLQLTEAEQEQLLTGIRANLNGINFVDISAEAKAFIQAHSDQIGSLYIIDNKNSSEYKRYVDFSAVSKAYVDLGVWMMKEGLTPSSVSSAKDIKFTEHTYFPGELPADAERVADGSADVLAKYELDPGYLMGGMKQNPNSELSSYLYRPTGYYAPAGEVVTISVDPALVNTGLYIRLGGQKENHMLLSSTNRFPLISTDYRIEAAEFEVINPLGGGIYLLVPQDTDIGWVSIGIKNAVRAPYFSSRAGHKTPTADWNNIKQYPGLFAEFESDKFMITVPTSQIQNFDQPDLLLQRWDRIMDIFQIIHGRPLSRVRSEAYMLDSASAVVGSYPGGYPVTPGLWAEGQNGITDGYFSPFAVLNYGNWEENEGFSVMLHELGHHHYGRFIEIGEQEAFVNVPGAAVLNDIFDLNYDDALKYSGYQRFSRIDAAIDWMVTYNFRNGNPIGNDPTTEYQPIETSYQARGYAKYLDIADIFDSWDALGDIYNKFYLQDLASGTPADTQIGVTHDEFLREGSEALQCNLASLFHFWGIHPSAGLSTELSSLSPCDGALERLTTYLDTAPRTNEDLRLFHQLKTDVDQNQVKFQIYDPLLETFDHSYGQQIRDIGASILATYFDVDLDQVPSTPVLNTAVFNHTGSNDTITFAWTTSVDPEGHNLQYSWRLINATTDEVLLYKSWIEGSSVDITKDELTQALASYVNLDGTTLLAQEVTTSDLFTIVKSERLESAYRKGSAVARNQILADFDYSITDKTVVFSEKAVSANQLTYSWDFGDESSLSNEKNPTHNYAETGVYTVTLTVTDGTSLSDIKTETVVIGIEASPDLNWSVSNTVVSFNNLTTNGIGELTYSWNFGDGNNASSVSPQHTYSTDGTYSVVLTVTDEYSAYSKTKSLTISTSPSTGGGNSGGKGGGGGSVGFETLLLTILSLVCYRRRTSL